MCVYRGHVGYGYVAWLSYNLYGEVGFEGGLIKTGEGRTCKGGFKLRGCQNPNNNSKRQVTSC